MKCQPFTLPAYACPLSSIETHVLTCSANIQGCSKIKEHDFKKPNIIGNSMKLNQIILRLSAADLREQASLA